MIISGVAVILIRDHLDRTMGAILLVVVVLSVLAMVVVSLRAQRNLSDYVKSARIFLFHGKEY